jgi:pyridoxine 5-phosphate synthase
MPNGNNPSFNVLQQKIKMTKLSININKIALIRNSRGANLPDLLKVARDLENWGAHGITVHPRPDERHIRYADVADLKGIVQTELNVEGNPDARFMAMVLQNAPHQCTLVPDAPTALTSDGGWDTITNAAFLKRTVAALHEKNIRVSLFVNADERMVEAAAATGCDRIEFYTGDYSHRFLQDRHAAIAPHKRAAAVARACGLGINAGHDLNLDNLRFYKQEIEGLDEVSIGHAIVCDALYMGLQNVVQMYLREIA